ncbi:MAG: O-antigen ligase family protein [Candidatus Paceibacterota bacterium]
MQVSSAIIIGYAVFAGLKYGVPISILVWGMVVAAILNIAFSYENIGYFHRFEASRPAGLIGNANALAIFLSFVAFLLYFLTSKKRLLIKCIVFFLLYFVFFFTGSRKGLLLVAMIILLIGIDYLIWQKARISPKRCMVVFLVLVIFLGFCFTKFSVISKDVLGVQRVEALLRGEDRWSAQTRYLMIDQATNLWLEKPFLGWGGGGFAINSGFGTYSHNNYVELLSNYGLVGFCLYYAFYVYLFAIGWSLRKEYLSRVGFLIIIMLFILEWGFVSLGDKTSWILLGIAAHCIIPYRGVI